MQKLKTIHIDSEMGWSGGQRQVSALCSYLHERGHEVKIICRPGSELGAWAKREGIAAIPVKMGSILSIGTVLRIRSAIRRERPDVVHLHASRAHVLGGAAARMAGVPLTVVTRRMDEPVKMVWPNTGAYNRWVNVVVAISEAVKDVLIESGVDPARIRVINSGAEIDRFADAKPDPELRSSLGVADGAFAVCTAATLAERKGVKYLIQAASMLGKEGKRVHLIIAGEGEQRAELEQLADKLNVAASFVGFRKDMPNVLATVNAFAMPALAEGLGIAVIEAMAAGRPVIASAVGGLRESVIDGETGFLIAPRDPRALADAIGKLIDNPGLASSFGAAGQARAREHFSLANMAARNEALYYELID